MCEFYICFVGLLEGLDLRYEKKLVVMEPLLIIIILFLDKMEELLPGALDKTHLGGRLRKGDKWQRNPEGKWEGECRC